MAVDESSLSGAFINRALLTTQQQNLCTSWFLQATNAVEQKVKEYDGL